MFVRMYAPQDAVLCKAIIDANIAVMPCLPEVSVKYLRERNVLKRVREELVRFFTVVFEEESVVLGLGVLYGDYIKRVYVDPSAKGRGIGTKLMRFLEKEAVNRGISELKVASTLGAKSYYEKLGYTPYVSGKQKKLCVDMKKKI